MSFSQHPIIYTYLKKFQDDPSSRVFAPLAEAYRKAGLVDQAIKVAREGLAVHPHFVGGRVALARALFDKQMFQEVIGELSPIAQDIPDNLVAQRLLGESYLILGKLAEALGAYKMLLYFCPQDREVIQMVQELEAQAYEGGALVLKTDVAPLPTFDVLPAHGAIDAAPEKKKAWKVKKIELFQGLLQRVERHRHQLASQS